MESARSRYGWTLVETASARDNVTPPVKRLETSCPFPVLTEAEVVTPPTLIAYNPRSVGFRPLGFRTDRMRDCNIPHPALSCVWPTA